MKIVTLPMLSDNYGYLLVENGRAWMIDPSEAEPVRHALAAEAATLERILVTHAHHDHIGGIKELKAETGCRVIGPADPRISGLDDIVEEGAVLAFGAYVIEVLSTPGHGRLDVSYLLRGRGYEPDALFCGDALFVSGCGRISEGTAEQLWASLTRLASLPPTTLVYCGHEYAEDNLRFASSVEPEWTAYKDRLITLQERFREGLYSVPSTIAQETVTNPFLRADTLATFIDLRQRKDRF